MPQIKFNLMKFLTYSLAVIMVLPFFVSAQNENKEEFKPSGKVIIQGFLNYKYDITEQVKQKSAFQINRAYFGYQYEFTPVLAANITFDVGKDDGSAYTTFLKFAYLDYEPFKFLKLTVGQFGQKMYDHQEKLWDHRYIMKSFGDQYGIKPSADLGLNAFLDFNKITANLTIENGEGFKKLQDDFGYYRYSGNLVYAPIKGLTVKVYGDYMAAKKQLKDQQGLDSAVLKLDPQQSLVFYAGYMFKDIARLGAEYYSQMTAANVTDRQISGISVFGGYNPVKKIEIFGRFDLVKSNKVGNAVDPWNYAGDGKAVVGGVQYTLTKIVRLALNYQGFYYDNPAKKTMHGIFINLELKN